MTQKEKAKAYDEALKQIKECTPDENGFITIYPQEIFPELKESADNFELVEQKPTDKAERKFKIGDWVVYDHRAYQVVELPKENYINLGLRRNGKIEFAPSTYCRLWTIQDAKDGDVLHAIGWHSDCIFIFNGLDNWKFDEPRGEKVVATGYCSIHVYSDKIEFGTQGPDCIETDTITPATQIQCDLLFQQIKVNGYEWDADTLAVRKVEHEEYSHSQSKI